MDKDKLRQIFSDDPGILAALDKKQDSDYLEKIVKILKLSKGKDGYTPVVGKDFYTKEEIASIKQEIINIVFPSDKKLREIIAPLIPEPIPGISGRDADETKIAKRVLSAIPIPEDGRDGKDGKDGSSDTAEQIVEKINTLESVLDVKIIKNLPDFDLYEKRIDTIEKSNTLSPKGRIDQRWHGAGLAKVSHDSTLSGDGTPSNPLVVIGGGDGIKSINLDSTSAQTLVTGSSGTDFVIADNGTGIHTFNLPVASASNTGKLSNTDWTTFNNKGSGTVTSVSGTSGRITSTGGTTPVIDIDAAYVGQTSITSLGTIATGTWSATTIALNKGGTGQTTKAAAFDALQPMTNGGDIIYGGTSGTGTRLANGNSGQVLTSGGTTAAPTWQTPTTGTITALTGDVTASGSGSVTATLATVNSNVGTFGSATKASIVTVNGKGLVTAASESTVTPAIGSITGLGTGIATALAVNVGSAGAPITFNGDAGTPSVLVGTNISGTAASLTSGKATVLATARNIGGVSFDGSAAIVPQTIQSINEATDTTCFPLFISASGSQSLQPLNNSGFVYNSNTNALTATTFVGALTGTASGNLVSGGALGTPSSGTGTNITGIPAANILAGSFGAGAYVISTSLQAATIELGAATDTTLSRVSAGLIAVEGVTVVDVSTSQTLTNKTLTSPVMTAPALGTPTSGVMTNVTGLPAAAVLAGTLGTGAYTMDTKLTVPQLILTANAIAASSNAVTVPVTSGRNIVTNSSAATLTITMTTKSAVNMQTCIVQILDFSAAAQTITWVNTENSIVAAPTTSNGSTTLPLTVGFIYNSGTSKWRCIAQA